MKKLVYAILLTGIVLFVTFSCSSDDLNSDKTPPEILATRLNYKYKIKKPNTQRDSITINRGSLTDDVSDTLIIGESITLTGHFRDDFGLSGISVSFKYDYSTQPRDTSKAPYDIILTDSRMFGSRDTTVYTVISREVIPQEYTTIDLITGLTKLKPILEGNYIVRIICMDISGKQDSIEKKATLVKRNVITGEKE